MKLSKLLEDYEPLHSTFQLERFVLIRNGQTPYGCFKQVLRELVARIPVVLEACNKVISSIQSENKSISQTQSECQPVQFFLFRDQIREFCILYKYAISLKRYLGELTASRKRELEHEYWITYAKASIARDFISEGRLTVATLELIHALPLQMRSQVLQFITHPSQHDVIIDWYFKYELELPLANEECWQGLTQMIDEWFELHERERFLLLTKLGIQCQELSRSQNIAR